MDSDCEESLICGRMNCAKSTSRHCCTKSCINDSDCTSGECNAEHSQCRLNSATVDWSKCSQDSPCADGEGDCDHHTDCEGTLLCGNIPEIIHLSSVPAAELAPPSKLCTGHIG